ncbi:peptidase A24 [Vibrio natriegens]|uniref:A24 family peptidase n=1 Tax=Vibrio natriegens TaxID=691 RepID=UPI0008047177|nr:prepilin peptidase [Vibrio natriegens]ANQ22465.1 peptidase A24 [Vibrio natriegens]ANQ27167.1 peptidase A24 [Vibrio natriegens]MCY9878442.1 prepilin peptidase [Vibrio natriegens]
MTLIAWILLFVIGVSDVQRHRIPNFMIVALLVVVIAELCLAADVIWWQHIKGFLITFAVGFAFYALRLMAGGDVKLLAVIGLWLGGSTMWQVMPFVVVAGGVVSLFYLALHVASSRESIGLQMKAYAVQRVSPGSREQQPLVIPFAPAIVIGLAYYFYIH